MEEPAITAESKVEAPTKPKRQALVLSGGGVRGAYQAGAIAEILKPQYGFQPNAVYGISVGSINGGMLATYVGQQFLEDPDSKQPDFKCAGQKLKQFWLDNITDHTKIADVRNRFLVALEVIFKNYHGLLDVSKSIDIIRREIHREDLIRAAEKGDLKFYAGTVNLTTGQYRNIPYDDCEIVNYIIASAMGPVVMPMRIIPEKKSENGLLQRWKEDLHEWWSRRRPDHQDADDCWLDGGIHNVAPVSAAVEDEYEDIVCVLCRPETIGKGSFQGRLGRIAGRVSDVATQNILEDDIQWALDMQSLMSCLDDCVRRLPPEQLDKYKGQTKFLKYRNFTLRVVRPKDELLYEAETLKEGGVEKMVADGREDAREVMLAPPMSPDKTARSSGLAVASSGSAGGI